MTLKEEIHAVKNSNPSWGYRPIALKVGCSPSLVKYYLNEDREKKALRLRMSKFRKSNPLQTKLDTFC